ncbi:MAG: bacillithiol biosynthesis cysteine-adding enzyme BshC [Ignavibacterium sp.]|nr:bacillithiol biosynthesis cysteine-adding enzyme BshC [Ignavibacterium sp.]
MADRPPLMYTDMPDLRLLNRGKVRDIYDLGEHLLIVATDRISAFDVVLPNGIPYKGKVLNQLSAYWFNTLADIIPHHMVTINLQENYGVPAALINILAGRAMIVKKAKPLPVECVVRGYLSGSAWNEYQQNGVVCGIPLPPDLKESAKLEQPIFTPATKAEIGSHDENIDFSKVKEIYQAGRTFKQCFRDLLFWLFDEFGLIIFDPSTTEVKKALTPIFLTEINNFRIHTQKLVAVSATLEEVYHAQVKVKPVNLFYHIDNGRHSIEPVDEIFKLKRKRKQFTRDEIIAEINEHPDRFSPNVLLRPITQDYLFPTAFYIAGPSEVSYFAQIHPLYEFFEIEPPVIYPRSSATLIEKSVLSFMEKYDLTMRDVFLGTDQLKEKILSTVAENNIEEIFDNAVKNVNLIFDDLKEKLFSVDKTISDSTNRYRDKVLYSINELKSKAEKAHESRFEVIIRQISKLSNLLYPNENLQERELNYFYFANKFGDSFQRKLYEELSISEFEHQIIEI